MVDGWVSSWDDSFSPCGLAAMNAAGYRVLLGYVAGGSSGKWSSAARIASWLGLDDRNGFGPLFESTTNRYLAGRAAGVADAKAARAGARARGIPDSVSILPAVDTDVAASGATIRPYFEGWAATDTVLPTPYVEADAGGALVEWGLALGVFTPAAYSWNSPPVLYTPANAPAFVTATQERNGVSVGGGDADIGHTRTSARCVWWSAANGGGDMTAVDLTPAAVEAVRAAIMGSRIDNVAPPASGAPVSFEQAERMGYYRIAYLALNAAPAEASQLAAILTQSQANGGGISAIQATLAGFSSGAVAGGLTPTQLADIYEAAAAEARSMSTPTPVTPPAG